jgi:hypothetical protein
MDTNTTQSAPSPPGPAVIPMIVLVASPQMPVAAHIVPSTAIPTPEDAQPILVASHSAITIEPKPSWALVVVIFSPQVPVGSDTAPVSLMVPVESAQPVQVNANAPVPTPHPLVPAMEMVIVVVATP